MAIFKNPSNGTLRAKGNQALRATKPVAFKEETSEHFVPGFMVAVDHEVGQAEEAPKYVEVILTWQTLLVFLEGPYVFFYFSRMIFGVILEIRVSNSLTF